MEIDDIGTDAKGEEFEALSAFRSPEDVAGRPWDFVGAAAAAFGQPLAAGDGCDAAELAAAQQRLGLTLPERLVEAYRAFGRRTDLTATQDQLLAPGRLQVDSTGEVLVFRAEAQWCAWWGVPLATLPQSDPPVVVERLVAGAGQGWSPHADRLSWALAEMALFELAMAQPHSDNRELTDSAVTTLQRQFPRLPLPSLPFWPNPAGPPVEWHSGPDVLLRNDGNTWLWVAARTQQALHAVRETLPGDWLLTPDL